MSELLKIPYRAQTEETSCGIAAFEMAYKYLRPSKLSKFSQQKVYARLKESTPDGQDMRVSSDAIVKLGHDRGFHAGWGRASPDLTRLVEQVRFFLERRVPLIACQRWHANPQRGHFRVIVGIDDVNIIFYDPETGPNGCLPLTQFIEEWRPSAGGNVTGGVAIWISDQPLDRSPLGPDQPNPWTEGKQNTLP